VNEIDFCMAPSDVSLSRSYSSSDPSSSSSADILENAAATSSRLSLTRALNRATNRALRRILLSRSWPSDEALNRSLRQVLSAEKGEGDGEETTGKENNEKVEGADADAAAAAAGADKKIKNRDTDKKEAKCPVPRPILNVIMRRGRNKKKDVLSVDNRPRAVRPRPRGQARSEREYVEDQIRGFRGTYGTLPGYSAAEAYLECVLSLATSGNESPRLKEVNETGVYDEPYGQLISVLKSVGAVFEAIPDSSAGLTRIATKLVDQDICLSMLDKIALRKEELSTSPTASPASSNNTILPEDDLGAVLLSSSEPSMTRQLNILSNIVQRALLFGGDEELIVLSETLEADKPAFVKRWYPNADDGPGVQYLSSLITLLQICHRDGVVTTLEPPILLTSSYANAYDRLLSNAVSLGSGYVRPFRSSKAPLPKTPEEELNRFAKWETAFRLTQTEFQTYPDDLVGEWTVTDEIAGKTIGVSTVNLLEEGAVNVVKPMTGLRWRLDPGPTHLDTCTFQVLGDDGTILQYKGFIDRGARLEARFSKRPIKVRGSVTFQMRDGEVADVDFYKDMLPIGPYKTGMTRFVMTKNVGKEKEKKEKNTEKANEAEIEVS